MKETFLLLSILICLSKTETTLPQVCLETGTCYNGSWITTDESTTFAAFRGIRYAKAPINELRFKKPEPIGDEGLQTIDVSANNNIQCLQKDTQDQIKGQEDCLVLNIYIPKSALDADPTMKLPVMVFIHGGGFTEGDGGFDTYGPHYFMDQNVIMATINYRLGNLGFLFLGTEQVSGNAGFRDQTLALKWIKTNIQSFHGDDTSITIFGESAGSVSVGMHLISPLSRGLFQRAIMQSGTPLAPWASMDPNTALKISDKISSEVNCKDLECLQSLSPDLLLNAGKTTSHSVPDASYVTDPFMPRFPEEMFNDGEFDQNTDIMIGHTKDEGILYLLFLGVLHDVAKWSELRGNFDEIGPKTLFDIQEKDWITQEDIKKAHTILEFYVESIENVNEDHKQEMIDMYSDAAFIYHNFRAIDAFLKHGINPYFYIFQYAGEHSFTELYGVDPLGVSHGDDLFYQWKSNSTELTQKDDLAIRSLIVKAWTDFAKNGHPNPSWQRTSNSTLFWNIDDPRPAMTEPDKSLQNRINFWKNLNNPENSAVQILSLSTLHFVILQYFLLKMK